MATAVRALAIMLYFLRRNGDPIAVIAHLAGDPMAVLEPGFRRRTVNVVAAWYVAIVWHHPGGIKPLMDGLILRRMVLFLRYGGTDGEDEGTENEKG